MQTENRFAKETQLFEAMLPDLLKTDAKKWFVAWDGELHAIVDTFDDAIEILAKQPDEMDILVREITVETLYLPIHFSSAK